jgi:hypothetical protein
MAFQFGFSNDDDDEEMHDAPISMQSTSAPAPGSHNASTVPVKAHKLEDLVGTIIHI